MFRQKEFSLLYMPETNLNGYSIFNQPVFDLIFSGIPCRHIMAVREHAKLSSFEKFLINVRWKTIFSYSIHAQALVGSQLMPDPSEESIIMNSVALTTPSLQPTNLIDVVGIRR